MVVQARLWPTKITSWGLCFLISMLMVSIQSVQTGVSQSFCSMRVKLCSFCQRDSDRSYQGRGGLGWWIGIAWMNILKRTLNCFANLLRMVDVFLWYRCAKPYFSFDRKRKVSKRKLSAAF